MVYNQAMKRIWQIGNILTLVFALVANGLISAQVLGLPAISDISDKYATYLTPAGYAFSIWSLIYVLLIVFVVYQARDIFKPRDENDLPQRVGPWFIIASICNALWTYVFVSDLVGLSVILLLLLTVALYVLLWRLDIAMNQLKFAVIACVWWPLLIYTGWMTVASVVNVASWLDSLGMTVSLLWSNLALIGLGVGLLALLILRNVRELLLACIWGIASIGVQQAQPLGDQSVMITAFTVAGILLVAVIAHAYQNRKSFPLRRM